MAMPPAISIFQSLSLPLPDYPYTGPEGTSDLRKGSHTDVTHPALFAIRRDRSDRWFLRGQQYLNAVQPGRAMQYQQWLNSGTAPAAQQPHLQLAVNYAFGFLNNHAFLPEQEGNIAHNNEADVVRSAALYLIHPVAQALWACPDYFKGFASQSEDTELRTRTDLTFYKIEPPTPQRPQIRARDFAVVEFKRRGWIKGEHFSHEDSLRVPTAHAQNRQQFFQAILTSFSPNVPNTQANPNAQAQHQAWLNAQQAFNDVVAENRLTGHCFSRNALNHIKQAAAYSILHRTRYVALFNYDYLVLCYFPWLDTTKDAATLRFNNQAHQDYPVETDVYPISVMNPQTNTRQPNPEVRLALLGFLQDGFLSAP